MRSFSKKFLALLTVLICLVMIIMPMGCGRKEKKGIIMVCAFGASNLIEVSTGDPLWVPLKSELTYQDIFKDDKIVLPTDPEIYNELIEVGKGLDTDEGVISKLTLNEDGTDKVPIEAANMNSPERLRYGVLNIYKELYDELVLRYSSEYEVTIFQYDWRADTQAASIELENMIKEKGYTEVMLLAHSMGGIVVSGYLARSEENRNLVKAFVSYATPFLGSMDAFTKIENVEDTVATLPVVGKEALKLVDKRIKPLVYNMTAVYELMPFPDFFTSQHFKGELSCVTIDGKVMTNYSEYTAYISNRPYSHVGDNKLRTQIETLDDFHKSFYIKQSDDTYVHVSKLVNTYYFTSKGKPTTIGVSITDGEYVEIKQNDGDGTVPNYSATCGLPLDDPRVVLLSGVGHVQMGISFNEHLKPKTFEIMDNALSKHAKKKLNLGG